MKKFALILFLLSISNTFAQTASEDILGKWQLQSLEIDGYPSTPKESFNTSEVFQVYSENHQFEGIVGDDRNKGTWKISEDQKSVNIKLDIQEEGQDFMIIKITSSELELEIDGDQNIKLYYMKKM